MCDHLAAVIHLWLLVGLEVLEVAHEDPVHRIWEDRHVDLKQARKIQ